MASKPPPSLGTPQGVPTSGNTKYVIIAVILVAAIGGAIAWKKCQEPTVVTPPLTIVDAGPPPKPSGRDPFEDVPPPPAIEDAGGEDSGKKPGTTTVRTADGCDAKKCGGAASSEIETALQFRAKQAHRCYDNALAQDPTLKGKVSIALRIGANGNVCSAGIASNDMGTPSVANCVAGYFRGANFPAPKGGCVDVNVPINFVPRQ